MDHTGAGSVAVTEPEWTVTDTARWWKYTDGGMSGQTGRSGEGFLIAGMEGGQPGNRSVVTHVDVGSDANYLLSQLSF